jgi:N-acetylglucosaminyldiphosphoundecaprenol N-acetyl-beta-D-mannosaminyltransferase
MIQSSYILGMKVSHTSYSHAVETICEWAEKHQSRYVCVATVNNVMEAFDSTNFRQLMNEADLVTPDGMPVVWGARCLGHKRATRVYGPDLTPLLLEQAARLGLPVGFYGGAPHVLEKLVQNSKARNPHLHVAYAFSPPFRPLSPAESKDVVAAINDSGARILFVGLNTPKQDLWMAAHKGSVQAVMVGVGAAFDFLSGSKPQAPRWMMPIGLEWAFRLIMEPKRLWRRYLRHNPRFILLFSLQLLGWELRSYPIAVHKQ